MDIILATNTDNPTLQFRNVSRFSDGSGYGAELLVRSRAFSVELPFYFEVEPLRELIANLDEMDKILKRKALLKPMYEDDFIEFEIDESTGHVEVRGEMFEHSEMPQSLTFEFQTDQTCLAPLVRELKKWQQIDTT